MKCDDLKPQSQNLKIEFNIKSILVNYKKYKARLFAILKNSFLNS